MRIAYLMTTHSNSQVLAGTVRNLQASGADFYIHVDLKSEIEPFLPLRRFGAVFAENRIPVYWGEYSLVEAILGLLRQALSTPHSYDYFVLLSGTDYPLWNGEYISRYFAAHHGDEFISAVRVPAPGHPISRISNLHYSAASPILRILVRLLVRLGLAKRDLKSGLGDLVPYAGSTWWALSRPAVEYILDFLHHHPRMVSFFRRAFVADEAMFHTILANSSFAPRIRRNLLYEIWPPEGNPHPQVLRDDQVSYFESCDQVFHEDVNFGQIEVLFARKFFQDRPDLLSRMDAWIAAKSRQPMLAASAVQLPRA